MNYRGCCTQLPHLYCILLVDLYKPVRLSVCPSVHLRHLYAIVPLWMVWLSSEQSIVDSISQCSPGGIVAHTSRCFLAFLMRSLTWRWRRCWDNISACSYDCVVYIYTYISVGKRPCRSLLLSSLSLLLILYFVVNSHSLFGQCNFAPCVLPGHLFTHSCRSVGRSNTGYRHYLRVERPGLKAQWVLLGKSTQKCTKIHPTQM